MRADEIVPGYRGGMSDGYQNTGGEAYPRGEAKCTCPTCGSRMRAADMDLISLVERADLPPKRKAILNCLIEAFPASVSVPEIAQRVYGDGNTSAVRTVRVLVCLLRDDIASYGWLIPLGKPGKGSPGYRLKSKLRRP